MNTLVVNCYGGPGAGKTACAWDVAATLKKKGINVEYVPEVAKEYVWDGCLEVLKDQERIFREQTARLERLRGKVEVIVTDSPILLSHIYGKNNSQEFSDRIDAEYISWYNFNLFIKREGKFHQEGRIQNLEESKEIDLKIIKMLTDKDIFYGTYSYKNLKYLTENIINNLRKIQKLKERKI